MGLVLGQATVPASSTVQVFILPPGTVNTVIWQPTPATSSVYLGTSVNVSAGNGMMISVTPLNTDSYVSTRGTPVFATTGSTAASSFMYIISGGGLCVSIVKLRRR
jgi:hypothetical protein